MKAKIVLKIGEEIDLDYALNQDFTLRNTLEQNISHILSSYFLKRVSVELDTLCKGFSSYDPAEYIEPSYVEIEYE